MTEKETKLLQRNVIETYLRLYVNFGKKQFTLQQAFKILKNIDNKHLNIKIKKMKECNWLNETTNSNYPRTFRLRNYKKVIKGILKGMKVQKRKE